MSVNPKIFVHGLESSNQGTKSLFFREYYPDMIIPHFTGNLRERMVTLEEVLSNRSGIRFVGSSFGGLMASIFTVQYEARVDRLILLAPAINMMPEESRAKRKISVPVHIYHGTYDEVIPLKDVEREAEGLFHNLTFHVVDDDHFLHNTFRTIDWDKHLLDP